MQGLEKKKSSVIGIGAAAVLVVAAAAIWLSRSTGSKVVDSSLAYYSDDDGKTWYTDSSMLFPPYDHIGKTAVGAEIFTYDNGSKQFCGYLTKYTDEAKKKLEASSAVAKAHGDPTGTPALLADPAFLASSGLVKLPGSGNPWVSTSDPRAIAMYHVRSPDGSAVDSAAIYKR